MMVAGCVAGGLSGVATQVAAAPPPGITEAANTSWQPFPAIYRDQYWAQYEIRVDYSTLLTSGQTRMLRDTGALPALADTGLVPWNEFAQSLLTMGAIDTIVDAGGCLLLGYLPTAEYSPTLKEKTNYTWLGFTGPEQRATYCYP